MATDSAEESAPQSNACRQRGWQEGGWSTLQDPHEEQEGTLNRRGESEARGMGTGNREGTLKICIRRSSSHPDHTGEYPFPNPAGAWNFFYSLDKMNQEGLRVGRAMMRL